jgi:hypothetical protein
MQFGPLPSILPLARISACYVTSASELTDVGRFLAMPGIFKGHKIAMVVSSNAHLALARLLIAVANAWGIHMSVFTHVDEAEIWLSK